MSTPTITKIADRSYTIESDIDAAIELLNHLFHYVSAGKPGDLYAHRWTHIGPQGRTMIVLFRPDGDNPPRLSVLGPRLESIDGLAEEVAR